MFVLTERTKRFTDDQTGFALLSSKPPRHPNLSKTKIRRMDPRILSHIRGKPTIILVSSFPVLTNTQLR